jgi:hypothetical protein
MYLFQMLLKKKSIRAARALTTPQTTLGLPEA